jgi:hypothetical protein
MDQGFGGHMDRQTCYELGHLFASPWDDLVAEMSSRAAQLGLDQEVHDQAIAWKSGQKTRARFCFVRDPSDIEAVRRIYNDEANAQAPVCFIVVRQPDPTDERGDIIFDIFRMSPVSYLWHFYRVYTPPKKRR